MLVFKPTKLSIIIPVLNSHKIVIRQARHFKKMDLPDDIEILIIDDGSNPPIQFSTGCRNFQILYTLDRRPWTQGIARNLGARFALGDNLLFCDIDIILSKEAIMAASDNDYDRMVFPRECGILDRYGRVLQDLEILYSNGLSPRIVRKRKGIGLGFHPCNFAIKRKIFVDLDGFNPNYCQYNFHAGKKYMSEDRDFYLRWSKLLRSNKYRKDKIGPSVYQWPVGKFHVNGEHNPGGMFHSLSLEQTVQPLLP